MYDNILAYGTIILQFGGRFSIYGYNDIIRMYFAADERVPYKKSKNKELSKTKKAHSKDNPEQRRKRRKSLRIYAAIGPHAITAPMNISLAA